jgi:predicted nucleic acid-binding protein
MVRFELLWTSRDHAQFLEMRDALDALRTAPTGERVWRRALDVFEAFARRGPLHHRQLGVPDLLIAAAAELAELPILHYDRDFELIAEVTGQPVRAIAPLGSLA